MLATWLFFFYCFMHTPTDHMDLIVTTLELVAQFRETAIKLRVNVIMSVRMNGHIPNAMQGNLFFLLFIKRLF